MDRYIVRSHSNGSAVIMCDPECVKRFERIELLVVSMANDMKWLKWLVRSGIIVGAAALGVDITGVI